MWHIGWLERVYSQISARVPRARFEVLGPEAQIEMTNDIDIEYGGRRLGSITIVKSPTRLHATRSASGFEIQVPMVVTLLAAPREMPRVMVSNLQGKVYVRTQGDSSIGVGRLRGPDWESAGVSSTESYYYPRDKSLEWTATFDDIAYIEKIRDGQAPKLQMDLRGEWCFLLPNSETNQEDRGPQKAYSSWYHRSDPMSIACGRGYIEVAYPRDVWLQMVQKLGVAENVLVEVPLPPSPPGDWQAVWSALVDARNAFEQGGTTGWKGCITSVRLALEKWQKLEVEKPGPGWQTPKMPDRQLWTKKERLDALRWYLLNMAHLGAHTGADEWSRDEALLLLSTLSALLAERRP